MENMTQSAFAGGELASLVQILNRREARVAEQKALLAQGGRCLVSFTMNIPGAMKRFPLETMGFEEGWAALKHLFPSDTVLAKHRFSDVTGDEGMLLLSLPPQEAKQKTVGLEDGHPLGRLWDMDVLDAQGRGLVRDGLHLPPRSCLLCGQPAKICARSRRHEQPLLFRCAAERLETFFQNRTADVVAACGVRALMAEVSVTPKPGLVDRNNSGAHKDMGFFTFLDSASGLMPWFRAFFQTGWVLHGRDSETLFEQLRCVGRQAEEAMFRASGGVNTHKGMIFSMAILCGALGRLTASGGPPTSEALAESCKELGAYALKDISRKEEDTNGKRCFRQFKILGVRGEAASGFQSVFRHGLPILKERLARGWPLNDAAVAALLSFMSEVADTNMIHRGGIEEAGRRQAQSRLLAEELDPARIHEIALVLDGEYIQKNLSPGGCADLLAVTLMLWYLEHEGLVSP